MTIKVGVVAEGKMQGEIVSEAKRVLNDLAVKYNCRFELSKGDESKTAHSRFQNTLTARLKDKSKKEKSVFLSFGGELEL